MTLPSVSFSGLATPFDAGALIDQILAVERVPLLQLQSRKGDYQAKDNAWGDVTTRLSALRSKVDAVDFGDFYAVSSSNETAVAVSILGTPQPGAVTFDIDALAAAHQEASDDTLSSTDDTVGNGKIDITVDGTKYTVTTDASTTLAEVVQGINDLDIGVTAQALLVDTDEYKLVIGADTTGDASEFTVNSTMSQLKDFTTAQQGTDAQLTMGGLSIERPTNTVTDLLDGVSIQLKAVTTDPVTVTVTRDTAAAADAMVTDLNAALDKLGALTDYNTDSEAAGLLLGDPTARSIISALRNAVSGVVGGTPGSEITASAAGISITRDGRFEFDRSKLEEALADDYDGVRLLFEDGMMVNLDDALDATEGVDGSIERARDRWQAQIEFVDDRIDAFEDRLERREGRLIKQFAALDLALAQLNAQASWLTAQVTSQAAGG